MKFTISIFVIAANIFFISCKKDRSCSCKYSSTTTEVTTPRGAGQSTTTSSSSTGESTDTFAKVKKDDLTRLYNCNSRTESSTNTHTTMIVVMTPTSVSGYTFTIPTTYTADVAETDRTDYTCEIK